MRRFDLIRNMKWWLADVENAIQRASDRIVPVADSVAQELNIHKTNDLFIVGGFVRDNVLAALTGKKITFKDLDLILPERPLLENNPNILRKRKNSLGGTKICTKNFPEIDIFQPYTTTVDLIVGKYFDFNCNALYYSHYQKQILPSAYFYGFTSDRVINFVNYIYGENGIEQRYGKAAMVARALKFKVMFHENFGIKTKLSSNILYLLYNMDKQTEQEMFNYVGNKVKTKEIQNKIISEYNRLNNR